MKKYFFLFALLIAASFYSEKTTAQVSAGAGFQFGTAASKVGFQLRGMYQIDETWRASADLVFYLDNSKYYQFFEANTNGHYIFLDEEKSKVYALAGLNIFRYRYDGSGYYYYDYDYARTKVGLNVGVGGQYFINEQLSLQSEIKYALSYYNSLGITVGAAYQF
jgi:hypothetical protein